MELKINNLDQLKEFMENNLLKKQDAMKITEQTATAFQQSEQTGKIKPFFETDGKGPAKIKLYLKSDMEEYARNKRK